MKERPILFNGAMVRATLDGSKTQTRRVVKPQPREDFMPFGVGRYCPVKERDGELYPSKEVFGVFNEDGGWPCPYGGPGDRLFMSMASDSVIGDSLENRFWRRVIKTENCWEWMGSPCGHAKHGRIRVNGKTEVAHRLSWKIHRSDPGAMQVLHKCDVGWCVNPDHLYLGTSDDNRRDQTERNRIRHLFGDLNPNSKITDAEVLQIMEMRQSGKQQSQIATYFGIHQSEVSCILSRKRRSIKTSEPLKLLGSRWLEITAVRVQRLQDISEEDCYFEGIPVTAEDARRFRYKPKIAFEALWESINGKGSWSKNPWVFAISFRRLQ